MKAHVVITDEDLEIARKEEAKRRHDVMGHVQYVPYNSSPIPTIMKTEDFWRKEAKVA